MNRIVQVLKSRTVWTIVVLVGLNTIPQLKDHVSPAALNVLDGVLGALAVYLHVNPAQKYPLQKKV